MITLLVHNGYKRTKSNLHNAGCQLHAVGALEDGSEDPLSKMVVATESARASSGLEVSAIATKVWEGRNGRMSIIPKIMGIIVFVIMMMYGCFNVVW